MTTPKVDLLLILRRRDQEIKELKAEVASLKKLLSFDPSHFNYIESPRHCRKCGSFLESSCEPVTLDSLSCSETVLDPPEDLETSPFDMHTTPLIISSPEALQTSHLNTSPSIHKPRQLSSTVAPVSSLSGPLPLSPVSCNNVVGVPFSPNKSKPLPNKKVPMNLLFSNEINSVRFFVYY
ncbi:hypothetical protein RCL1_007365 [Eukaryota sp. TZLM3-RCL]